MGISSPLVQFGYNATTNVMYLDETTYIQGAAGTTYELLKTIYQRESIAANSVLRLKVTVARDGIGGDGVCSIRYFDGTTETELFNCQDNVWTEYEDDVTANWNRSGELRYYVKCTDAASKGKIKDIKICGERAPFGD